MAMGMTCFAGNIRSSLDVLYSHSFLMEGLVVGMAVAARRYTVDSTQRK